MPRQMKLRQVFIYRAKKTGKPFYRFDVTLPPEAIEQAGWTPGIELSWSVEGGAVILRREG